MTDAAEVLENAIIGLSFARAFVLRRIFGSLS